jgi:DNA processing protein
MLGVGAGPDAGDAWEAGDIARRQMGSGQLRSISAAARDAIAILLSVHGLGPLTLGRLVDVLGSPAEVLRAGGRPGAVEELVQASRPAGGDGHAMGRGVAEAIVEAAAHSDRLLAEVRREGLRVVAVGDPDYPSRLLAIEVPPPALFVRGTLEPLAARHVVAVVGTRRPSPAGRRIASRIGSALARAGATVVSGLAIGVDGAAHAAVVGEQGPTVAFIGGGHGLRFPRAHDRLADAIVDAGGAVVSEYAPMTLPSKGTFPQRNRLISGASDAVVVVEAGARSGALVTASWALEQGRECFIVPGSIDALTSAGCNGFLRDWPGLARIVSGIPQLLDDLGLLAAAALVPPPASKRDRAGSRSTVAPATTGAVLVGRTPVEHAVGEALVHGAVTVDELVAITRNSLGDVLRALTRLEAGGLVRATYGRYEPAGQLAAANPKAA